MQRSTLYLTRDILQRLEAGLIRMELLDGLVSLDAPAQAYPVAAQADTLRARIQERKARDLSQAEIAKQLGVSGATVSRHLRRHS